MLMLLDYEVASTNTASPIGSSLPWNYVRNVLSIERGDADLCNNLGIPLIGLDINADEDDRLFLLKFNQLTRLKESRRR